MIPVRPPARLLLAVLLLATTAACVERSARVTIGRGRFEVELAESEAERERGLMYRDTLAPGSGMLFVLPHAQPATFWMKNTHLALDILWFDAKGRLAKIDREVPPCRHDPCPLYPSGRPVGWVLEIAAGEAARHGLRSGDRLVIEPHD